MHTRLQSLCVCVCTQVCMRAHMYIHVHTRAHKHTCTHTHTHTYTCTHTLEHVRTLARTYMYMHVCLHACIHTHVHTHTQSMHIQIIHTFLVVEHTHKPICTYSGHQNWPFSSPVGKIKYVHLARTSCTTPEFGMHETTLTPIHHTSFVSKKVKPLQTLK